MMVVEDALNYLGTNEVLIRSLSHSGSDELCSVVVSRWDLVLKNPKDDTAGRALVEAVGRLRDHRQRQERRK